MDNINDGVEILPNINNWNIEYRTDNYTSRHICIAHNTDLNKTIEVRSLVYKESIERVKEIIYEQYC